MKILSAKDLPNGNRVLRVEVGPDEVLVSVQTAGFYSLGEPLRDDVVTGDILSSAIKVVWCSATQRWVS